MTPGHNVSIHPLTTSSRATLSRIFKPQIDDLRPAESQRQARPVAGSALQNSDVIIRQSAVLSEVHVRRTKQAPRYGEAPPHNLRDKSHALTTMPTHMKTRTTRNSRPAPRSAGNLKESAMPRRKIYLCGPIMDESEGKAREWRQFASKHLGKHFTILDPMRRNFKDREVDSANEIVEFDLQDVRDADIVLVNYNKASVGTSMEVFFASHVLQKFVIGFSPFSFQDCSPWMVRFCTKILPSLESATAYINEHFVVQHFD